MMFKAAHKCLIKSRSNTEAATSKERRAKISWTSEHFLKFFPGWWKATTEESDEPRLVGGCRTRMWPPSLSTGLQIWSAKRQCRVGFWRLEWMRGGGTSQKAIHSSGPKLFVSGVTLSAVWNRLNAVNSCRSLWDWTCLVLAERQVLGCCSAKSITVRWALVQQHKGSSNLGAWPGCGCGGRGRKSSIESELMWLFRSLKPVLLCCAFQAMRPTRSLGKSVPSTKDQWQEMPSSAAGILRNTICVGRDTWGLLENGLDSLLVSASMSVFFNWQGSGRQTSSGKYREYVTALRRWKSCCWPSSQVPSGALASLPHPTAVFCYQKQAKPG